MTVERNYITKTYRQGAVGALLDEYERAIADLQQTIADISDEELITIADGKTSNTRCRSVQTILSHVVTSGLCNAIDIRQLKGQKTEYPDSRFHMTINDYKKDLNDLFIFILDTFKNIRDADLEQFDNDKKIKTYWGQVYDIEQITEHAIVHILRHRRQIEKFKIVLREHK
jgi:hypothetical protein